ncbi:hypothetical protein MTP99_016500 [Tenebrio molitor]|nr:hypothetical protein MTP99_016500 [Tenebrio molitor]
MSWNADDRSRLTHFYAQKIRKPYSPIFRVTCPGARCNATFESGDLNSICSHGTVRNRRNRDQSGLVTFLVGELTASKSQLELGI